uniref:Syndecan n=1 Tax=Gasterosteus aculeatus TaxID=69293 RepID=G3NF99_GASAC
IEGAVQLTTACLVALQIADAAKTSSQADDLYLDDAGSGGYYPEDDDDFNSGSGSGKNKAVLSLTQRAISQRVPLTDATKDFTPKVETPTVREPRKPVRTEAPAPVTEDAQRNQMTSTTSAPGAPQDAIEVRTENLFQRTEVLAAVIAGGVIGFLFAIFLILLLVYRMRKKDEGSYDLGERKPSGAAYQKAPTKEFYA